MRNSKLPDGFFEAGMDHPVEHSFSVDKIKQYELKMKLNGYVGETLVRCMAPSTLLTEIGVTPDAVDILLVDAELYDVKIVNKFMELNGFAPSCIQFEIAHLLKTDQRHNVLQLLNALAKAKYDLHQSTLNVMAMAVGPGSLQKLLGLAVDWLLQPFGCIHEGRAGRTGI